MSVKVSVILPVYNASDYLHQCMDSIVGQTLKDIEIILVDDGSPDNCGKICDEYAAKDTRIKVIHKENGGLSSARNAGMEVAEGEYIGFVDSDDWIESDMYMTLWQKAKDINADLVNCDYFRNNDRIKTNIQKNIVYDKKCIDELLTTSNSNKVLWFVWRNIYRRKLINDYKLDGIDLDWEYPGSSASGIKSRPQDRENFTLLITAPTSAFTI